MPDARRYDEAIDQYKKAIELDPSPTTHYFLARAYEAKGMYDEAVAMYTRAASLGRMGSERAARLNEVYKKSGWTAYLQANVDQLVEQSPQPQFPPFVIATFYGRLGKKHQTIQWLEKGYEERDFRMTLLSVAFEFDKFRSDLRFNNLVRRMGLPE